MAGKLIRSDTGDEARAHRLENGDYSVTAGVKVIGYMSPRAAGSKTLWAYATRKYPANFQGRCLTMGLALGCLLVRIEREAGR